MQVYWNPKELQVDSEGRGMISFPAVLTILSVWAILFSVFVNI